MTTVQYDALNDAESAPVAPPAAAGVSKAAVASIALVTLAVGCGAGYGITKLVAARDDDDAPAGLVTAEFYGEAL